MTPAWCSTLAGGLLVAVSSAGAVSGRRSTGSCTGLVDTRYGVLLLVRIGRALAVAVLDAWNRWVVLPRVRAATGDPVVCLRGDQASVTMTA